MNDLPAPAGLTPEHLYDLRRARELLLRDNFAIRLTDIVGRPIEAGLRHLPEQTAASVQRLTRRALGRAARVALATMRRDAPREHSYDRWHKAATAASGAAGGFFGLGGLAVELPVTTMIMLRSIGDIARSEGHDVRDPWVQLACLEVLALGGPHGGDDAVDTGYWAVRAALARAFTDAARHLGRHGFARGTSPVVVRLLERISTRFGIVVQEKVALGALPVVGALTASMINAVFTEHFQHRARGHFIVRRLETIYGTELVRDAWYRLGAAPQVDPLED
jgi:hypothetical protein